MDKELTLKGLLVILVPVFVIVLSWGKLHVDKVGDKLEEHDKAIVSNKIDISHNKEIILSQKAASEKLEVKMDKIQDDVTKILVKLEGKKDR